MKIKNKIFAAFGCLLIYAFIVFSIFYSLPSSAPVEMEKIEAKYEMFEKTEVFFSESESEVVMPLAVFPLEPVDDFLRVLANKTYNFLLAAESGNGNGLVDNWYNYSEFGSYTSPEESGFYVLSHVGAFELGFINKSTAQNRIQKSLDSFRNSLDTYKIVGDTLWEIGENEAPPDYSDSAFDEFDIVAPYQSNFFIETDTTNNFPKELNDWGPFNIYIYYNLTEEQSHKNFSLFLDTLYGTHGGQDYFDLTVRVKKPMSSYSTLGTYRFGSGSSEYPQERYVEIPSTETDEGENVILLQNTAGAGSGQWIVWDSLGLYEVFDSGLYYRYYDTNSFAVTENNVPSIGNAMLASSLVVVKEWAIENGFNQIESDCNQILGDMNLSLFYNESSNLFYHNLEMTNYWDYYSDEGRLLSFIANALGFISDLEFEENLDTLTQMNLYYDVSTGNTINSPSSSEDILVNKTSWDGSIFTYFVPSLFIQEHLTDYFNTTLNPVVEAQIKYANLSDYFLNGSLVWGISDVYNISGDYCWDYVGTAPSVANFLHGTFYETCRGLITPHAASFALLSNRSEEAIDNLKVLSSFDGLYDSDYGFRDSVNVLSEEVFEEIVTLDQEWIFLSLINYLNNTVWKYLYRDSRIEQAHEVMYPNSSSVILPPSVLEIINVEAVLVTNDSAGIVWITDEVSNSSVSYGTTLALGQRESTDDSVTSHSIDLVGLLNSTRYYYNVTSCNGAGICNTTGPYSFVTAKNENLEFLELVPEGHFGDLLANVVWIPYIGGEFTFSNMYADLGFPNGEFSANIYDGGGVDYFVQISRSLIPIFYGRNYTVSFRARADANRDLIVQVGEEGGDYTLYGNDTFSLNTQMTSYSFTFTMTNPTDYSGRLAFNMGLSDVDLYIDDVSLKTTYKSNITNCLELQDMRINLGANYTLVNDIDCSDTINWNDGKGFDPVGGFTNRFTGSLNGNGYVISGLVINRSDEEYVGLFGYSSGDVENVGLENVEILGLENVGGIVGENHGNVTNSYSMGNVYSIEGNIGGLAGVNYGNITKSYSTGNVSNGMDFGHVGGLVGFNFGSVIKSYSTADVYGNLSDVGGLVGGFGNGFIVDSYAMGDVSNPQDSNWGYVGGLVGEMGGVDSLLENCYASGKVFGNASLVGGLVGYYYYGTITNSYWDIETSGQIISGGGVGRTTAEMKIQENYLTWSFNDIWFIRSDVNLGYPLLRWSQQTIPEDFTAPEISSVSHVEETDWVRINWITNEVANSIIRYGLSENSLDLSEESFFYENYHNVVLSNLWVDRLYYYNVTSCDISGNCDTLGPYSFRTEIPECGVDLDCDDGIFCNGAESCSAGVCIAGSHIDCSQFDINAVGQCDYNPDNNPFTWDYFAGFVSTCDEVADSCTRGNFSVVSTVDVNMCGAECLSDSYCDDGIFCNGAESCNAGQCASGDAVDCSSFDILPISECGTYKSTYYWIFFEGFVSSCDEGTKSCTQGREEIVTNCDSRCGAACSVNSDCPVVDCDYMDGCVGNDYYDYSDLQFCSGCQCNVYSVCSNPVVTANDARCREEKCITICSFGRCYTRCA